MSITELIKSVGEENVQVQFLHECLISANKAKRGTHITFGTTAVSDHDLLRGQFENICAIVWMPRSKVPSNKTQ